MTFIIYYFCKLRKSYNDKCIYEKHIYDKHNMIFVTARQRMKSWWNENESAG